jgi:hypothetical protein
MADGPAAVRTTMMTIWPDCWAFRACEQANATVGDQAGENMGFCREAYVSRWFEVVM